MIRRNLFEILDDIKFDVHEEYVRLFNLFWEESSISVGITSVTLCEFIEASYFRELKCRGTYTTIKAMVNAIFPSNSQFDIDNLYLLCEFLLAMLPKEKVEIYPKIANQVNTIIGNITVICEKTNHTVYQLDGERQIIIEKSKQSMQAVELVADTETAVKIIEYNHYALKGQLQKKKEILCALGQYLEPTLTAHTLKNAGYGQLESDIGFLLNNFHIRHNNKEGNKAKEYIASISNENLEEWYDKTYNSILSAIIIVEQISISSELKQIKENYSWRT